MEILLQSQLMLFLVHGPNWLDLDPALMPSKAVPAPPSLASDSSLSLGSNHNFTIM